VRRARQRQDGSGHLAKELLAVAAESGGRRLRYGWTVGADSHLSTRIDALLASGALPRERGGTSLALAVVLGALAITAAAASVRFTPLHQQGPATGRWIIRRCMRCVTGTEPENTVLEREEQTEATEKFEQRSHEGTKDARRDHAAGLWPARLRRAGRTRSMAEIQAPA
jgi:hypothetical protein